MEKEKAVNKKYIRKSIKKRYTRKLGLTFLPLCMFSLVFGLLKRSVVQKYLIYGLVVMMGFPMPSQPLFAQSHLQLDATRSQNTKIVHARNGVPVVSIATPSQRGVSANYFNHLNVDLSGMVLNNSATIAASRLAGVVPGNQNVKTNLASMILLQATGRDKTNLRGIMEVMGQRAGLVIANPQGIYVDGAGFINAPRVDLLVGNQRLDAKGALGDRIVSSGHLEVGNRGLNFYGVNYASLLANQIILSGQVAHAKELSIQAEAKNTVNKSLKPSKEEQFGIDSSYLGGIYAGKIALISSTEGLGVRLRAPVVATQESLKINAEGVLVYGVLKSETELEIKANESIVNSGYIVSGGDVNLEGKHIQNQGGEISALGSLSIDELNNQDGLVQAGGNVSIENQQQELNNKNGLIAGFGQTSQLSLRAARSIHNLDGAVASNGQIDVIVAGDYTIEGDFQTQDSLNLTADSITNQAVLQANAGLSVTSTIGDINNTQQAQFLSNGLLQLSSAQNLFNEGVISSIGAVQVEAQGGFVQNKGSISSQSDLDVLAHQTIDNQAYLSSLGTLQLEAAGIQNTGQIAASTIGVLKTSGDISNAGLIYADNQLDLKLDGALSNHGDILSLGSLAISSQADGRALSITNNHARIQAGSTLLLKAEQLSNIGDYSISEENSETKVSQHTEAVLESGADMVIDVGNLHNKVSRIQSGGDITIIGDQLNNEEVSFTSDHTEYYYQYQQTGIKRKCKRFGPFKHSCKRVPTYGYVRKSKTVTKINDHITSTLSAKGNLNISAAIINGGQQLSNQAYESASIRVEQAPVARAAIIGEVTQTGGFNLAGNLEVPQGNYGLFRVQDAYHEALGLHAKEWESSAPMFIPQESLDAPILIQTNTALINTQALTGTSDILEQLNYNVEQENQKILGDAYYEKHLLKKTMQQHLGVSLLDGYTSQSQQVDALYQSALNQMAGLNLVVGQGLTDEQQAQLTDNMLWMVEMPLAGQKVLVPHLYLTSLTKTQLSQRAKSGLVAQNILLQASDIQNTGIIQAQNNVQIIADSVSNQGLDALISGNQLVLSLNQDLYNKNGFIHANSDSFLQSISGSLRNESGHLSAGISLEMQAGDRIVNRMGGRLYSGGIAQLSAGGDVSLSALLYDDELTSTKRVVEASLVSNSDLSIQSGGNLSLDAARVNSDGVMSVNVGGDLKALSQKEVYQRGHVGHGGYYRKETVKGSQVAAGSGLILDVAGDVGFEGSRMDVGDSALMAVGGNVSLEALNEQEEWFTERTRYSGLFGSNKKKKRAHHLVTRLVGSQWNIAGDLSQSIEGELKTIASGMKVDGTAVIEAKQGMQFLAGLSNHKTSEQKKSLGWFSSKAKSRLSDNETAVASQIEAGSGLSLSSQEGSIQSVGSQLKSSQALVLQAKEGLMLSSAQERQYHESKSKSGWGIFGIELSSKKSLSRIEDLVQQGSMASALANASLSAKDIAFLGSHLEVVGDAHLDASNQLSIASVEEYQKQYEEKEKQVWQGFSVDFDNAKFKGGVTSHVDLDRSKSTTNTVAQKESQVLVGGDLSTSSGADTHILGSQVMGASVAMTAGGDIMVKSTQETQDFYNKISDLDVDTRLGFGNAWADTAHSAHDAAEKLQKVANSDSSDKSAVNTAAASIEAMQAAAAVAKTAQNVARSANSAGTMGFYASLSSHITGTEETERSSSTTNRASLVRATSGDLEMLAEGALAIRGSDVIADSGNITLQAKTGVSIESDSNNQDSSQETHQVSERHEYWNSTGIIDLPSISQTESESDSATRTYRNSHILATKGNLTVISEADARIEGAQLIAKNTTVDVAGTLDLESKQDTERHRSKTEGYGIGLDNISVQHQEGKQDTAWVKNQTKIIGTESVSVGADTLNMVGSMIANQTESGEDGGNLVVQVNQLNSRDLYDKDKRFDHGYAFGVQGKGFETGGASTTPSTGGSSTKTSDGTRNGGSVSVGLNESGYDREQITKATIGQGTLTVAGSHTNHLGQVVGTVNRDISQAQTLIKDKRLDGLDIDTSIQTRFVMDPMGSVAEDVEAIAELPGNMVRAGQRVGDAASDLVDTAGKALNGEIGIEEVGKYYGMKIEERQRALDHQVERVEQTDKINDVLAKGTRSESEVEQIIEETASYIQESMGVSQKNVGTTTIYDGSITPYKGYHNKDTADIGINVGVGGVNLNDGVEVWEVVTHEVSHQKGEDETWAHYRSDAAKDAWERENSYNGNRTGEREVSQMFWVSDQYRQYGESSVIYQNTKESRAVNKFDPYDIRTGRVERQDTLSKITKEVNAFYGTDYDYVTMAKINKIKDPDKINVGDLIQIGTIDENGTIWKPAYKEGVVNNDYWNQLEEDQQEITHYHRRVFEDKDLPKSVAALDRDEEGLWELVKGDAVAHNIGTEGNIDYRGRGPRANQQAIYDKHGMLVTTPENGGSYDFVAPPTNVKEFLFTDSLDVHLKVDVDPWLKWGNTPEDTTIKKLRVEVLSKTWKGREGLKRLGYKKNPKTNAWVKN